MRASIPQYNYPCTRQSLSVGKGTVEEACYVHHWLLDSIRCPAHRTQHHGATDVVSVRASGNTRTTPALQYNLSNSTCIGYVKTRPAGVPDSLVLASFNTLLDMVTLDGDAVQVYCPWKEENLILFTV